jgi:hypothetical protein
MTHPFLNRILILAILVAPMAAPLAGQAPTAAPDPEYTTLREMKSRLFLIQHRSASHIQDLLRPLGSGFKGTSFEAHDSGGVKAISVRDFPENLAVMEEAVKRLDQPEAALKEVEMHLHVLFASRQEGPSEGIPEELKEVLTALKSTLAYRSYAPAATFVLRCTSEGERQGGRGETEVVTAGPKGERVSIPVRLDWSLYDVRLEPAAAGPATLLLKKFEVTASDSKGSDLARMRTDLSLKVGEKVVVGTTTIKDKGLIVVLTAKVLN